MGFDLDAFVDVDENFIEQIIKENDWDARTDHRYKIAKRYVSERMPDMVNEFYFYHYNSTCKLHELHFSMGTNFIRDDKRFDNRRFIRKLEKQHGKKFSSVLANMCFRILDRSDALEVVDGINVFFKEDEDLMKFADWLRRTARYCSTYESDY